MIQRVSFSLFLPNFRVPKDSNNAAHLNLGLPERRNNIELLENILALNPTWFSTIT